MKDQIEILEKSLRTNIAMTKAMVRLKLPTLAKQYLKLAKKDRRRLRIYRRRWNLDATNTIEVICGNDITGFK